MNWKRLKLPLFFMISFVLLIAFLNTMPKEKSQANNLSRENNVIDSREEDVLTNPSSHLQPHGKLVAQSQNRITSRGAGPVVKTNDFRLTADDRLTTANQPYVVLDWENVSGINDGYLVQRSTDSSLPDNDALWQTPPTNYGKKVKILNVYPVNGNFLKTWMDQLDPNTGQPVSMGLIEVTPVSLIDFNNNPDSYLKDAAGNYQYDGIYFGSSDGNNNQDLNSSSVNAVKSFGQTGRSVIFGHDTVMSSLHPYFNNFASDLGIQLMPNIDDASINDDRFGSNVVQFSPQARNGYLTKYPYLLDPNAQYHIQPSHSGGQFYLYSGGGTRWMEYLPPYYVYGDSGIPTSEHYLDSSGQRTWTDDGNRIGDNNDYLVTKNNYAIIQTGHTTGSCTPDEAKVIANMVYYTSSLNTTTHGEDHTVSDTTAPDTPGLSVSVDKNYAEISVIGVDLGTDYYYRIKAQTAAGTKYSDVVKSTITSGIKGYVYQIDTDPNGVATPVKDANGVVTNINTHRFITVNRADGVSSGGKKYLHIVAVDNNNNFDVTKTKTVTLSDYLWWNVDSNKVLTIYPHELNWDLDHVNWTAKNGQAMQNWPWVPAVYQSSDESVPIFKAVISPGVTVKDSMYKLFSDLKQMTSIEGLDQLDTSQVTNMSWMFNYCYALQSIDLTPLNTANVTDMSAMFRYCRSLKNLNLTPLNTSRVTNMSEMFFGCVSLTGLNLAPLDTRQVNDMSEMFWGCSSMTSLDVTPLVTSNVTNMKAMFDYCSQVKSLDVTHFDTSKVTDMSYMFGDCRALTSLDVTKFNTSQVTTMRSMFRSCNVLPELDVTHFDTSKVTDMGAMFSGCGSSSLDVTHFDTSKVIYMDSMFAVCSSLPTVDVTHFDTSQVTRMDGMFSGCQSMPTIDVTHFDTRKVTTMNTMFASCGALTQLDIRNFVTNQVNDMGRMFEGCIELVDLKYDFTNFNTSQVKDMDAMFASCQSLPAIDVTHFDTSQVTRMDRMFYDCTILKEIDLRHFNTSKVIYFSEMFAYSKELTQLDLSSFDTSQGTNFNEMFSNCLKISSLDLSNFNTRKAVRNYGQDKRQKVLKNMPSLWKLTLGPDTILDYELLSEDNLGNPVAGTKIKDLDQPTLNCYATSDYWQEVGSGGSDHNPQGPKSHGNDITRDTMNRTDKRTYVWDQEGFQTFRVSNVGYISGQNPWFNEKEVESIPQIMTEKDNRNFRQGQTWKIEAAVTQPLQLSSDSTKIISGNPLWFHDTDTGNKYNLTSTAQTVRTGARSTDYQDEINIPWTVGIKTRKTDIPSIGTYWGQITFTLVNTSGI